MGCVTGRVYSAAIMSSRVCEHPRLSRSATGLMDIYEIAQRRHEKRLPFRRLKELTAVLNRPRLKAEFLQFNWHTG